MAILQETIGARIRALRNSQGWTQEELGAHADLDFTTIGGAERGEKSLSLKSLSRVAQALGVELAWLVRQEETESGRPESEELVERLLALVRNLDLNDLRHVVELVELEGAYLARPKR